MGRSLVRFSLSVPSLQLYPRDLTCEWPLACLNSWTTTTALNRRVSMHKPVRLDACSPAHVLSLEMPFRGQATRWTLMTISGM